MSSIRIVYDYGDGGTTYVSVAHIHPDTMSGNPVCPTTAIADAIDQAAQQLKDSLAGDLCGRFVYDAPKRPVADPA